jgi:hypothetical protein
MALVPFVVEVLQMADGVAINGGHDCYKTLLDVATNRNAFLFFSATSENLRY